MADKLDLAKLKAEAKYLGHHTFGGNVRFSDPTRQHPVGQCQQCTVLRLIERVERLESLARSLADLDCYGMNNCGECPSCSARAALESE